MSANEELATESQALTLLYAMESRVDPTNHLAIVLYPNSNKVDLPEAIQTRNEIDASELNDYYGLGFCYSPHPPYYGELAVFNLLYSNVTDRTYPRHHIQYRVIGSTAGSVTFEKHLLGEPRELEALDQQQAFSGFIESLAEKGESLDFKSDDDHDNFRLFALTTGYFKEQLDKKGEIAAAAEKTARSLGITAVYADEATALIRIMTN